MIKFFAAAFLAVVLMFCATVIGEVAELEGLKIEAQTQLAKERIKTEQLRLAAGCAP